MDSISDMSTWNFVICAFCTISAFLFLFFGFRSAGMFRTQPRPPVKVRIRRSIKQVVDGSHYTGTIWIEGTSFTFDLRILAPISQFRLALQQAGDISEQRSLFQITLQRNGEIIETTGKELGFFSQLLVRFAVDFHDLPVVRDSNDPVAKFVREGDGIIARLSNLVLDDMTSAEDNFSCFLPPEICRMLQHPKLGCPLAV